MKSGYVVVSQYLSQETSVMISGSLPNISVIFLCSVDCASLYNLLQIEPAWCTNFLNMFIAFLYMFLATMCP